MATVAVTLGPIAFRDFEVPERIVFGGVQRLVVHQPIGGGRVVDVLGAEPGEIAFGGVFSGPDAALRAEAIEAARDAGAVLPLAWDGFARMVLVAGFGASYEKNWWIPFALTLLVVQTPSLLLPQALGQAEADLATAARLATAGGVSLQGAAVAAPASLTTAMTSLTSAASAGAARFGTALARLDGGGAEAAIGAVGSLADSAMATAQLAAAQAYLGRADANRANAG